jgi:MiaB/RimO family radical SAM methylthiotransferase
VATGRRELRLTAQDTALYGLDQRDKVDLPSLLREITSIDGDFMVRVGMMNPDSVSPILRHLMWAFVDPKVFKFLHIPVQSGSDEVLKSMGRGYRVVDFLDVVQRFREAIPELYLSTDIIAGFPGETDEDHMATIKLLDAVRPDVVNLKAFSARPGTEAKAMNGRVHTSVVKARTEELHELKKKISCENLAAQNGREMDVLLTERPKPGSTMGRSMEYRPIVIKGEATLGKIVRVRVTGRRGDYLLGTQI